MICLISRDTKGKLRVAELDYEWSDSEHAFLIHRTTYQYGGKRTQQPDIRVDKGKAKRSINDQVKLQFAAKIKEYKDKGYKELDKDVVDYTESELFEIVGKDVTGQDGVVKPMLAKQADKVTSQKTFDLNYYASRKIDGLRCLIYLGKDAKLHTSSRGGMNYDPAMTEILNHPNLIKLFKQNPWLVMDGECYRYGFSLQQINAVARTQVTAVDYGVLQFYWYDIVDTNRTFKERYKRMLAIKKALGLGFDPEKEFGDEELRIQFVPQQPITGWNNIQELHDKYIQEGWEGVVIRNENSTYRPNGRTNDMIKIKQYQDKEFEIIGYELGLRGSEDMCFKCITKDGIEFLAKPHGSRELKQQYIDNFDTMCLGQLAVIKYFYYSDEGVPLQPSAKGIRIIEDIG